MAVAGCRSCFESDPSAVRSSRAERTNCRTKVFASSAVGKFWDRTSMNVFSVEYPNLSQFGRSNGPWSHRRLSGDSSDSVVTATGATVSVWRA